MSFHEDDEILLCIIINYGRKGLRFEVEVERTMNINDFYGLVADMLNQNDKNLRLVYRGDRVERFSNRTMGDCFEV